MSGQITYFSKSAGYYNSLVLLDWCTYWEHDCVCEVKHYTNSKVCRPLGLSFIAIEKAC